MKFGPTLTRCHGPENWAKMRGGEYLDHLWCVEMNLSSFSTFKSDAKWPKNDVKMTPEESILADFEKSQRRQMHSKKSAKIAKIDFDIRRIR